MAKILFESGERNPKAKLSKNEVEEIKVLIASGMLQKEVSTKFGVSQSVVSDIVTGKLWKEG